MMMKKSVILGIWICATLGSPARGNVVEVEPERGRQIPSIIWTDDTGRTRSLSGFAGNPVVLLPVYTRCRTACIANASQLKKALARASSDQSQFRVLLFSFDSTDTPAMLRAYRQRENIPLAWSLGTADQRNVDRLLDSIGFQAGKAGSEFVHANLLVFLDPNLRIAKWIYGTDYSGRDVEAGLEIAAGRSDWLGQHWQWLYAICLFGASGLCVLIGSYVIQLRQSLTAVDRPIGPRSDPI